MESFRFTPAEEARFRVPEQGGGDPFRRAELPEPATAILADIGMPETAVSGWYAVPILRPTTLRIPEWAIASVDAYRMMEPLLDEPSLAGTLRTADVVNGCGHQCGVCVADAALPTRRMDGASLERLFADARFIDMLQPDSLRFGSSADIILHPEAMRILDVAMAATEPLDAAMQVSGDRHTIKVFTNYRPNAEGALDRLIEYAIANPERFRMTISLPFNGNDAVNDRFVAYAAQRAEVFDTEERRYLYGLKQTMGGSTNVDNVSVHDVRHSTGVFTTGRFLKEQKLRGKLRMIDVVNPYREPRFEHRGMVKTYLNPDALWLMVYATPYESHTLRAFTPITPENIAYLSHLPYHRDFSTPPNWPGGTGKPPSDNEIESLRREMKRRGATMHPPRMV